MDQEIGNIYFPLAHTKQAREMLESLNSYCPDDSYSLEIRDIII